AVGTIYAIQCSTNLAQANRWRGVALLKLPSSPYLVPGTAPVSSGSRFYRTVAMTQSNLVFIAAGTFTLGSPTNEVDRYYDASAPAHSRRVAICLSRRHDHPF